MPHNIPSYGMMVAFTDYQQKGGVITLFYQAMLKKGSYFKEMVLSSDGNTFPLKIKFVDKEGHIIDYILFKTRNEKLILQKPFYARETQH